MEWNEEIGHTQGKNAVSVDSTDVRWSLRAMVDSDRPKVVVAMSGGVDSSVVAALMVEQGYDVRGITAHLWSEPGQDAFNRCCAPDAVALARRVADLLKIPFDVIDEEQPFYDKVVKSFIESYARGVTPNPCLACNRYIRFGLLLQHASEQGAQYMATGHYVRLQQDDQGRIQMLSAIDEKKDQSYVLSVLTQAQLKYTLFPLGGYKKPEVRALARKFNLPVAERPDSQDLCLLGGGDYRVFLQRHVPQMHNPGSIETSDGQLLGQHDGLAFYTIGQRKGLNISAHTPYYVLEKNISQNILVVGKAEELGQQELIAGEFNWISGMIPASSLRAQVKIRYNALKVWGNVTPLDLERVKVEFDKPLRDITPGQAVVIYDGDVCLGGGLIESDP